MTWSAALAWPLSVMWGAGARLRAWGYRTKILRARRLRGVVVSVGNITVGGTGKTPMVAWVARRFASGGRKVGVLARGYRPPASTSENKQRGSAGWNDEVAMLHAMLGDGVLFGVGKDRLREGRGLERMGVEGFVLDDGFQHQQVARDVNVVMIDATNPFGGGRLLPSGRLREPASALRRADIIVIHRAEKAPAIEAAIRRHSAAPIFFSQTKMLGVKGFRGDGAASMPERMRKYSAFCGIGNPTAFFADLKRWGVPVVGQRAFRDHHHYTAEEMAKLGEAASAAGANGLICTAKDIYGFPERFESRLPLFFCEMELQFNDEEGLWQAIMAFVEKRTPQMSAA